MIVLNLVCSSGHRFEGWFSSADSFDNQVEQGLVTCPHCNGKGIERLPTAPHLGRRSSDDVEKERGDRTAAAELVDRLRQLADASEDVGDRFPDEARRIHYQEVEARPIRGQASLSDTKELLEEGIYVLPVPPRPRRH
jgi:hypothetical protein